MAERNVRMYNPTHRYDITGGSGLTEDPTVQWSWDLDAKITEVAVWDGQVYATGSDGSITVFETNGDPQWRFETEGAVESSPAVVDSTVYVGSNDHHVYALDAASGSQRWRFETDGAVKSSPAVVDGTVYVGSSDAHVYALDAAFGSEQWRFETDGIVESSPAVVDDTVFGSGGRHIYALDAATGTEQWSFETGRFNYSPTVVDDTVFIGSNDCYVYALDVSSGNRRWQFKADDVVTTSPAVVDGTVYVGDFNGNVHALNAALGTAEWRFETVEVNHSPETTTIGTGHSSSAVVNDTVYVASGYGYVYALDAATGTEQWSFESGAGVGSAPPLVVVDSTVYVGSTDGHMYALEGTHSGGSDTKCSNCGVSLFKYDNPAFCPECGTEKTSSGNSDTEIYDP